VGYWSVSVGTWPRYESVHKLCIQYCSSRILASTMSRQNFIDSWFSLQICVGGYKWSHPFSVDSEGLIHIILRREHDDAQLVIRGEVRNGVKGSRYLVVFRLASRQSPYRLSTILCS
jgi:hypothetical protein